MRGPESDLVLERVSQHCHGPRGPGLSDAGLEVTAVAKAAEDRSDVCVRTWWSVCVSIWTRWLIANYMFQDRRYEYPSFTCAVPAFCFYRLDEG